MAKILHIETATTVCSVAVSNDSALLASRNIDEGYTHAENLHVFVRDAMQEAKLSFRDLDAISVSRGPGSYTGLRIGAAAAKGFAYGLGKPLIAVDTLQVMASQALSTGVKSKLLVPMIDARRMEVYCAVFDRQLSIIQPTEALIITEESAAKFKHASGVCFFGNGMEKCRHILEKIPNAEFATAVKPSAEGMVALALKKFRAGEFAGVDNFEPLYLKEFLPKKPEK